MPKLSNLAEAFLDGFGCLGAIVEPAVRPGSSENLIQQSPIEVEPTYDVLPPRSRRASLIWFSICLIFSIALLAALFEFHAARGMNWVLKLNEVGVICFSTLFLREFSEDIWLVIWKRWRQDGATGAKARHRA